MTRGQQTQSGPNVSGPGYLRIGRLRVK